MIADLVLTNAKTYVNKAIVECNIAIDGSRIFRIGKDAAMPAAEAKLDLQHLLVLPGLIDVHVHLRDEDKSYKEDFYSGTAAAAAGGITTVLDMPNNGPVTMSAETLRNRMKIAEKKILVNVGFYSEFPRNMEEIADIVKEGAVAFKLFMGNQIGGLDVEDDKAILEAFKKVNASKTLVAVHAEDKALLKKAENKFKRENRNDIEAFLQTHLEDVEVEAVKRLLKIINQTNAHVHLCHVSTEKGLTAIIDGKKSGMPITFEATPHHLLLSVDDLKRVGTLALTLPPLRQKHNAIALWKAIRNGMVDILASDHAPHIIQEKKAENVWNVKVGIPNLDTMLSLLLTEVKHGRLSIGDVVKLMAEKPAETFGLNGKGLLKEKNDADLTVVDLRCKHRIDASKFHSKAKYSPFNQWTVEGKAVKTFVNGQLIMDEGKIIADAGSGKVIRRNQP